MGGPPAGTGGSAQGSAPGAMGRVCVAMRAFRAAACASEVLAEVAVEGTPAAGDGQAPFGATQRVTWRERVGIRTFFMHLFCELPRALVGRADLPLPQAR